MLLIYVFCIIKGIVCIISAVVCIAIAIVCMSIVLVCIVIVIVCILGFKSCYRRNFSGVSVQASVRSRTLDQQLFQ